MTGPSPERPQGRRKRSRSAGRRATRGLLALAAMVLTAAGPVASLLPRPAHLTMGTGRFRIAADARIVVPMGDAGAMNAARQMAAIVARTRGLSLTVVEGGDGPIRFVRSGQAPAGDERYRLDVGAAGIRIAAASDAGLLYGAMTLAQLLTPDARFRTAVSVEAMTIADSPRFVWRGVMLDVARHMQPIPSIKRVIDMMAQAKLNRLQLHLTDDQGWRIEIKRYPELTRIGAWRGAATDRYGGFYTQDELRELVAYAAARAVTIVPEIDLPGHAQAAIAAYPEVGVLGDRPPVSGDWGINPYLFDVSDQSLDFVRNVLDEVMAIFPSPYIHIGGDEALKDQWRASPAVQAKMRALGIADEQRLQSWFVEQLGQHLARHGRRLIGWDEILEGGLPASASVMSWRGEKGAIEAANMDHDVVLSPGPVLYLDNLQSARSDEPPGRMKVQTLADVYAYDPLPKAIAASKVHHVLGAQANLWAEYMVTPEQREHALFPRLAALAEMSWSPADARDWPDFLARLDPQMNRYARQGIAAADSAFAVDFAVVGGVGAAWRGPRVSVAMTRQAPYGTIRYTTDGTAPTARSRAYTTPVTVMPGTVLRATDFAPDGRPLAAVRTFDTASAALLQRSSAELIPCPGPGILLRLPLTRDATGNGPAHSMNIFNPCWTYKAAPLDRVDGIAVTIGRLPRNFALRQEQREQVVWRYTPSQFGTLMVHGQGCDGPVLASMPLPDPGRSANRFTLSAPLPRHQPESDLCLTIAPPIGGPLYGIDTVRLTMKDPA
ncbi:family 20 glycosylhydrolase [uncultured Sphingomonas sp.]|uniref:beta-N-acetylhexosaminidase n=1 Tax=uncultured Sphingomonas sp. TaxID=158754 RepID=UPI0025EA7195|nr:family 20 glycosylhydrolase [uncultured Sphingomonas sp.]